VVDEYYISLGQLEDIIEDFEDRAVITNNDNFITGIQDTKKNLFRFKRAMLPLLENIAIIIHEDVSFLGDELKPFLQDLQENLKFSIEALESYREWLSNIMDVNLSVLSYQMNKVMKILATVSAIFIPLTFIAGIYGMNFEYMPELSKPWGYPVVLGGMGCIGFGMVIFFKIRHWF
jgi:magnesium transporter